MINVFDRSPFHEKPRTQMTMAVQADELSTAHPDNHAPARAPTIDELRNAIPAKCFKRSTTTSLLYITRDCLCVAALFAIASYIPSIANSLLRDVSWAAYGFVQGLIFTGVWILAHECGHQALFESGLMNDTFGFLLHSFLLVPYFSWKHSHARHHRYHNNMDKDTAWVPPRKDDFRPFEWMQQILHTGEDTPVMSLFFLVFHQLIGWPVYLLVNATAGKGSLASKETSWSTRSHFDPHAGLFTDAQRRSILLSDLGLLIMFTALWQWSQATSIGQVMLTFGVPYLWVNHWIGKSCLDSFLDTSLTAA